MKIMQIMQFPQAGAELDMNAAAGVTLAWKPVDDMTFEAVRFIYTEAVAAGGFSTTKAAVSIGHSIQGASEVEKVVYTLSSADATSGLAIGTVKRPDSSFTPFTVRSGDTVNFRVKTQGAGGTVTGQLAVQMYVRVNPIGY